MSSRWIVAYDVSRDRDRTRTAARLLGQGVRLQRSVFEVLVDDPTSLLDELAGLIRPDLDVVQAFRQCETCGAQQLGAGQVSASMREHWWLA